MNPPPRLRLSHGFEKRVEPHAHDQQIVAAVRAATGLFALIIFSTFNNLVGGLYMALMDPYGLELFAVEIATRRPGATAQRFT